METQAIALFGETEKGDYHTAYYCKNLSELAEYFGNPPPHSLGLFFAIQALLYNYHLIFLRVNEEGFSYHEYLEGLHILENERVISLISAICLPGVGDREIIHAITPFCIAYHKIMITREADLYDYLTQA